MTDDPRPHNARVWNYWLGGTDNYPADRQAGDRVAAMFPGIVAVARANRAFLSRVVRYLAAEAGVRQFLDLGSGLPSAGATDPGEIARQAGTALDFGRHVGLLMLGVLNFIPDTAQVQAIVSHLTASLAPGSYLAITHPTLELGGEENARAMRFWNENATPPVTARTGAEIAGFFAGLRLLDPGLVPCSRWRPDQAGPGEPAEVPQYGAVARKE